MLHEMCNGFTQAKKRRGRPAKKIAMPVPGPLAEALARAPKGAALLLNSRGAPWTGSGFRASLRPACEKAEIDGLTFHDMRGTFAWAAGEAGATEAEISAMTGHGLPGNMALGAAYLKRSLVMAKSCVKLVEAYKAGTIWQTALQAVAPKPEKRDSETVPYCGKKRSDTNALGPVVGDEGLEPSTR